MSWLRVTKSDRRALALADGHYSRRKPGSPQFMPPGQTLCLVTEDAGAVWGWWRPDPGSGIPSMNGLDGWTCTIFRRVSGSRASELILAAEIALVADGRGCGPSGMLTYVWPARVRSENPGYCFKIAGWVRLGPSADGRKELLWKPFSLAGVAACGTEAPPQTRRAVA